MKTEQEQVERWCVVRLLTKSISKLDGWWLSYHKNQTTLVNSSWAAAQFADCNQAYDAAMAAGFKIGEFIIEPI